MQIAIYDLDRTLTRKPTFTPFLMFAARRIAPLRLLFTPVWVLAMIGYRLGMYTRTTLKRFGMHLMLGRPSLDRLRDLGREYARARIANPGLVQPVMRMLEQDREAGARTLLATAAFEFYAAAFGEALDFEAVIGTRWDGEGIPGGNCYGATKKARVLTWLKEQGLLREGLTVRFVSDSFADTPLLEWSDTPVFVTSSQRETAKAEARGWQVIDPAAI